MKVDLPHRVTSIDITLQSQVPPYALAAQNTELYHISETSVPFPITLTNASPVSTQKEAIPNPGPWSGVISPDATAHPDNFNSYSTSNNTRYYCSVTEIPQRKGRCEPKTSPSSQSVDEGQ